MDNKHLLAKIGQYALIKNGDKVLILERARSKKWCLPGGRLDNDEEWDSALIREVKEELGLDCSNPLPVDVNILKDDYQTKYCVYFILDCPNSSKLKISDEHSNYRWVGLSNIDEIKFDDKKVKKVIVDFLAIPLI